MSKKIGNTPVFRGSYPCLFTPKLNTMDGKSYYSIEALFDKGADLSELKAMYEAAGTDRWGADKAKWPKLKNEPFKDQGEKVGKDGALKPGYVKGAVCMNFKSQNKPGVVDQKVQNIIDPSRIYAGAYYIANVSAFAYPGKGKPNTGNSGISFSLNHVQLVKDGEPLSGRPSVDSSFTAVEGAGSDDADATSIF